MPPKRRAEQKLYSRRQVLGIFGGLGLVAGAAVVGINLMQRDEEGALVLDQLTQNPPPGTAEAILKIFVHDYGAASGQNAGIIRASTATVFKTDAAVGGGPAAQAIMIANNRGGITMATALHERESIEGLAQRVGDTTFSWYLPGMGFYTSDLSNLKGIRTIDGDGIAYMPLDQNVVNVEKAIAAGVTPLEIVETPLTLEQPLAMPDIYSGDLVNAMFGMVVPHQTNVATIGVESPGVCDGNSGAPYLLMDNGVLTNQLAAIHISHPVEPELLLPDRLGMNRSCAVLGYGYVVHHATFADLVR